MILVLLVFFTFSVGALAHPPDVAPELVSELETRS
jgi:hypothetical protein